VVLFKIFADLVQDDEKNKENRDRDSVLQGTRREGTGDRCTVPFKVVRI